MSLLIELTQLHEGRGEFEPPPEDARQEEHGDIGGEGGLDDAKIERLIAARIEARRNKDFATADRIRDELAEQGVILEDGPQGTTWRRA